MGFQSNIECKENNFFFSKKSDQMEKISLLKGKMNVRFTFESLNGIVSVVGKNIEQKSPSLSAFNVPLRVMNSNTLTSTGCKRKIMYAAAKVA